MKEIKFNDIKDPFLDYTKVKKNISKVIKNKNYILGKEIYELEKKLSKYVGSKHCVTTSSGTDALLIALMSLNLKKGSEVITPAFSYISSAEVILRLGLKPVFIDIDPQTALIDAKLISKKITKNTSCIVVVSLFGQIPNVRELLKLKKEYNLPIIEDAAQSFGARYKNKKSCNIFDIGCTSFFPTKSLGCFGDGGALFTNNKILAKKFFQIRQHGQKKKYYFESLGLNARLDTIQAAVLIEKLNQFDKRIKKRKLIFNKFKKRLKEIKNVKLLVVKKNYSSCFPILNIISNERNKLKNFLSANKIPTNIYYPLALSDQKIFTERKILYTSKVSRDIANKILSLPFHLNLSDTQINYIVEKIKNFHLLKIK